MAQPVGQFLRDIFNQRIPLPGGGHGDAFVPPDEQDGAGQDEAGPPDAPVGQDPLTQLLNLPRPAGEGDLSAVRLAWLRQTLSPEGKPYRSQHRYINTETGRVAYRHEPPSHAHAVGPDIPPLDASRAAPLASPAPASVPPSRWQALLRRASHVLSPAHLAEQAGAVLSGVSHPLRTAGLARRAAREKLVQLKNRYGWGGMAVIGSAYLGYYAAALAVNPALLAVPVPLTATLLTTAEIVRGIARRRGKTQLGTLSGLDVAGALEEVKSLLAVIAAAHGEEPPVLDEGLMAGVLGELLSGAG